MWLTWDPTDPARARIGRSLAAEYSIWLTVNGLWEPLRDFLSALPHSCPGCWDADRVLDARASLYVNDGDYESAMRLISSHCFPTYASDRQRLINLWWAAHQQMERSRLHRNLTRADTVRLRRRIGCDGDDTTRSWKSQCIRGPPNIGYAY